MRSFILVSISSLRLCLSVHKRCAWLGIRRLSFKAYRDHLSLFLILFVMSSPSLSFAELGQAIEIEGASSLDPLFRAMEKRELGEGGHVRMTHIGDSHIIADFWTGEMRSKLQAQFGDGGRGFVLGGEMWRSYSQRHIWHYTEGEWTVTNLKRGQDFGVYGPGGAALICSKESCLTGVETREGQEASQFDTLDIFTLGSGQGGRYKVLLDGKHLANARNFSPWLNVLRHRFYVPLSHHKVQVAPLGDRGELWLFGFSLKNSRGGLIYDAIGLNGSQAKHLLRNHKRALQTGLLHLESQVIILSFGINELFDTGFESTKYEAHLRILMENLREKESSLHQTPCLLTGPFAALRRGMPPKELDEVYQIQRALSSEFGCAFWDARSAMGGSIRPWQQVNFARKDGVHLSRKGYQRIATLFEESILMSYRTWKRSKSLPLQQRPQQRLYDRPSDSLLNLRPKPHMGSQPSP